MNNRQYLLMTPGPVQIPPQVLNVMAEPMIHHRTPEFEAILSDVLERLPQIFKTKEKVFVQASTGTGGMESAVVNTLSPGDKVLCVVIGKFGERWREICQLYGMKVESYDVPWGEAADPNRIADFLKKNPDTRAVLTQVCETSTGVLNPIKDIATVVSGYPQTLLMVDAITACGVIELPMDDWGLDVVVAASQKALMLPTGLSLLTFSKKAWSYVEKGTCPRFYWDVRQEKKANTKNQTHFSSSVPLIKGLALVLDIILAKGIDQNIKECSIRAAGIRAGAEALGFQIFSKSPSPSLTPLIVPRGFEGEKIQAHLEKKYRVTIAGGQDQLKGKIIRIGTMGYINNQDVARTIKDLACTLQDLETVGPGSAISVSAAVKAAEQAFG